MCLSQRQNELEWKGFSHEGFSHPLLIFINPRGGWPLFVISSIWVEQNPRQLTDNRNRHCASAEHTTLNKDGTVPVRGYDSCAVLNIHLRSLNVLLKTTNSQDWDSAHPWHHSNILILWGREVQWKPVSVLGQSIKSSRCAPGSWKERPMRSMRGQRRQCRSLWSISPFPRLT